MSKLINFDKVKKDKDKEKILKKSEQVVDDLNIVLYIITLAINGLSNFNKYVFVTECVSVLQSNKTLLEIHLNKYKKAIDKIKEEIKNGKLEEDSKKDSE